MPAATLTSKGQTRIPKEVREYLGVHAGDRIDFLRVDGEAILRPATVDVRRLKGLLHKPERTPVTVEEMSASVKKRFAQAFGWTVSAPTSGPRARRTSPPGTPASHRATSAHVSSTNARWAAVSSAGQGLEKSAAADTIGAGSNPARTASARVTRTKDSVGAHLEDPVPRIGR